MIKEIKVPAEIKVTKEKVGQQVIRENAEIKVKKDHPASSATQEKLEKEV